MSTRLRGRTDAAVARGEARRKAIIAAAGELFAESGYHATRLADVGARAGIGRPAVLHHFESKEALIHAVLDDHEEQFMAVRQRVAEHRGLAGIGELVQIMEFQHENRRRTTLWTMLLAESTSEAAPLRARMIDNYNQFRFSITWLLGQAQEDGALRPGVDFDREANVIIAFFNGLETSWLLDETVPIVDLARGFLEELVERIRKP
ncbi:MAG TPA: TetR/AcrR family transcriptional regulator [Solirubrobacterales bacterium]|nr:TetR/AcrR family transcriptional regulator [Solirubrobacterales bacterium]